MNQGPASHPDLPADLEAAVALGGEMGRRFAEFDWAAHPLGRPQDWSAAVVGRATPRPACAATGADAGLP